MTYPPRSKWVPSPPFDKTDMPSISSPLMLSSTLRCAKVVEIDSDQFTVDDASKLLSTLFTLDDALKRKISSVQSTVDDANKLLLTLSSIDDALKRKISSVQFYRR